ncbi:MAG: DUF4199 domain-containing protein [Lewinella sp.]|nr:DUF4199 domain-containing protein [Lewinella sp.]
MSWQQAGLRYGILAGVACELVFGLAYLADHSLVLNNYLRIGSLVIYLYPMWLSQRHAEDQELRTLLQPAFLTFVVANAVFYLFDYALFAYIDPSLVDQQAEMLAAQGYLDDVGGRAGLEPTPSRFFFDYVRSLIGGFVLAGILAFVRRQQ